jgi:hypothetical protein
MTYVKITTASFSAVSSVSIDNCFSASYTHYLVVRNFAGSANDIDVGIRLRVSGSDASGANYRRQYIIADGTGLGPGRQTGETGFLGSLGYTVTSAVNMSLLRVSNPFEMVRTTAWSDNGPTLTGNIALARTVYAHDLATSYTGFTVLPSAGTITGSITVYGLRAS